MQRNYLLHKKVFVTLATTILAFLLMGTGTAHAADGYVYVVIRNSACGTGNTAIKNIQVCNNTIGWSKNWDNDGDNITYPKVRLGVNNNLTLNAMCFQGSRVVGYRYVGANIKPTATGQTFWVG